VENDERKAIRSGEKCEKGIESLNHNFACCRHRDENSFSLSIGNLIT